MRAREPDIRLRSIDPIPFERSEFEESIVARFEKVARAFPSHIALSGNGEEWSYAELERRSDQIAAAIVDRVGARAGCVAYLVGHSPDMVIAALAILKAGNAYLCLHPNQPLAAQRDIIGDALPDLLVTDAGNCEAARQLANDRIGLLQLEDIDTQSQAIRRQISAGDPAVIFYTSGTTGRPKGVLKSHRAVLHRAWLCAEYDAVAPEDRQSLLTYCSFASSEADCFGALLNGATLELFDLLSLGLANLRDWIDARAITLLHPPVVLFRRYLSLLKRPGMHPSVRLVALAGDRVIASDLEQWRRHFSDSCALRHRFSSTEAGHVAVATIEPGASLPLGGVPAARAVTDKILSVVDEEGAAVNAGESGELIVQSAFLADGYWRREKETAESFWHVPGRSGERLFRTGDIVRLMDGGAFEFLHRRDTQVKIRGFRVETREIEEALLTFASVKEAAVIAEPLPETNALISFVVMWPGKTLRAEALRSELRTILPQWKVPAHFYQLESLPLTPTGKVDRFALIKMLAGSKAKNA